MVNIQLMNFRHGNSSSFPSSLQLQREEKDNKKLNSDSPLKFMVFRCLLVHHFHVCIYYKNS